MDQLSLGGQVFQVHQTVREILGLLCHPERLVDLVNRRDLEVLEDHLGLAVLRVHRHPDHLWIQLARELRLPKPQRQDHGHPCLP